MKMSLFGLKIGVGVGVRFVLLILREFSNLNIPMKMSLFGLKRGGGGGGECANTLWIRH